MNAPIYITVFNKRTHRFQVLNTMTNLMQSDGWVSLTQAREIAMDLNAAAFKAKD